MSVTTVLILCISVIVLAGFCAWRHDQCILRARFARRIVAPEAESSGTQRAQSNEVTQC
jgi:hypothetical protein